MEIVAQALGFALSLFVLVLIARAIVGFIMSLSRDWQPKGVVSVITEVVFSITDPPVKLVRRFIPPVQLGHSRLDLALLMLLFGCSILSRILLSVG